MTPQQRENLENALVESFDKSSLRVMLVNKLAIKLGLEVNTDTGLRNIVNELVDVSERGEWTDKLVLAAYQANDASRIKTVIDELGINILQPVCGHERELVIPVSEVTQLPKLEKIVNERTTFVNFIEYLEKLAGIGAQICRIEFPEGQPKGTGWLVATDLVLTNYHVIDSVKKHIYGPSSVVCRFGYFDKSNFIEQKTFKLANDWLIDYSPFSLWDEGKSDVEPNADELDYALLRLDGRAGDDILPNGETRKWVSVSENPVVILPEDVMLIPQHPEGRSLELAFGNVLKEDIAYNKSGTRLRYNANTAEGSSGSPCFNINLSPFGLHHSGRINKYNQCVPIREIIKKMKRDGKVKQFWK